MCGGWKRKTPPKAAVVVQSAGENVLNVCAHDFGNVCRYMQGRSGAPKQQASLWSGQKNKQHGEWKLVQMVRECAMFNSLHTQNDNGAGHWRGIKREESHQD